MNENSRPLRIAVVGSGISGLSAAWLLGKRHAVSLYEAAPRLGGHSNTVVVGEGVDRTPVDTGFIVFNEKTYPNFIALMAHLGVVTKPADMSFAVSVDGGALEYSGTGFRGIFGQRRNLVRPRFWSMLADLVRFYRKASRETRDLSQMTLGDYLDEGRFGQPFRQDHLYPMAAAIWSTPAGRVADYPAAAFIRFCDNHGLLALGARPAWRTVHGGSRAYVEKLADAIGASNIRLATPVASVQRHAGGVTIVDGAGGVETFDHVVMATHADQTLRMLSDADAHERRVLGAFKYAPNRAILHSDEALMPKRRAVWSSWNYLARSGGTDVEPPAVTYWMNLLQTLPPERNFFVTLNPVEEPRPDLVVREEMYEHPLFDTQAILSQPQVWGLQGVRNTWFCGAWMGAGFHEDGAQAGLAVAEALGGVRRPWSVDNESGRIFVGPAPVVASPLGLAP